MATLKLSRQLSKEYANKNNVSIEKLLTSIFVFHECGEFLISSHPHIELFDDGSGRVIEPRTNKELFQFHTLVELVDHADYLIKKHKIVWEED